MGGVLIATAAAIFVFANQFSGAPVYTLAGLAAVGVALVFGALLYLDITKCPNCFVRLGIQIANQYRVGRRVDYCPFCGVGFDACEMRNP